MLSQMLGGARLIDASLRAAQKFMRTQYTGSPMSFGYDKSDQDWGNNVVNLESLLSFRCPSPSSWKPIEHHDGKLVRPEPVVIYYGAIIVSEMMDLVVGRGQHSPPFFPYLTSGHLSPLAESGCFKLWQRYVQWGQATIDLDRSFAHFVARLYQKNSQEDNWLTHMCGFFLGAQEHGKTEDTRGVILDDFHKSRDKLRKENATAKDFLENFSMKSALLDSISASLLVIQGLELWDVVKKHAGQMGLAASEVTALRQLEPMQLQSEGYLSDRADKIVKVGLQALQKYKRRRYHESSLSFDPFAGDVHVGKFGWNSVSAFRCPVSKDSPRVAHDNGRLTKDGRLLVFTSALLMQELVDFILGRGRIAAPFFAEFTETSVFVEPHDDTLQLLSNYRAVFETFVGKKLAALLRHDGVTMPRHASERAQYISTELTGPVSAIWDPVSSQNRGLAKASWPITHVVSGTSELT
ncbi:hypothetical protein ACM66B_003433 [Microbotryomycetes sp. NB124-2]